MAVRDIRSVGSRRKSRERIYLTPRDSAPLHGARRSAEREEFTCQPELKDGGIARERDPVGSVPAIEASCRPPGSHFEMPSRGYTVSTSIQIDPPPLSCRLQTGIPNLAGSFVPWSRTQPLFRSRGIQRFFPTSSRSSFERVVSLERARELSPRKREKLIATCHVI